MLRIIHVDERAHTRGGLQFIAFGGHQHRACGELVKSVLARSISMMSACLVIAQNGR